MSSSPILPDELHAYLDGELTAKRRQEVAAWLADHPAPQAELDAWRQQQDMLNRRFAPVLDEPIPGRLLASASRPDSTGAVPPKPRRSQPAWLAPWSWQRIAASLVMISVSGAAGWLARDLQTPPPVASVRMPTLAHQAAIAHVVYSPDIKRPVEISAEHEEQLVTWLSKRLGTSVRPPRLGALGYELIGGRLLPGHRGPVAQFMYHDTTGQRMTLYVSSEGAATQDTAFRFAQEGPVNVFYWVDGDFGYALSAGIEKNALARVATAVHQQLRGE